MFCSSGPNLVILAWTGDKLSRGQASDWRTHRHTDRQTEATTIPEGQNWPRVKIKFFFGEMLSAKWRPIWPQGVKFSGAVTQNIPKNLVNTWLLLPKPLVLRNDIKHEHIFKFTEINFASTSYCILASLDCFPPVVLSNVTRVTRLKFHCRWHQAEYAAYNMYLNYCCLLGSTLVVPWDLAGFRQPF